MTANRAALTGGRSLLLRFSRSCSLADRKRILQVPSAQRAAGSKRVNDTTERNTVGIGTSSHSQPPKMAGKRSSIATIRCIDLTLARPTMPDDLLFRSRKLIFLLAGLQVFETRAASPLASRMLGAAGNIFFAANDGIGIRRFRSPGVLQKQALAGGQADRSRFIRQDQDWRRLCRQWFCRWLMRLWPPEKEHSGHVALCRMARIGNHPPMRRRA